MRALNITLLVMILKFFPGCYLADVPFVDQDKDGIRTCEYEKPNSQWYDDCIESVPIQDCDDLDASVYPGAPEYCDGRDNDCDDKVDEDCLA